MGCELHITRAQDWTQSDRLPITPEEWLAVVRSDPELNIDEQNSPYFAVWSGPCSDPDGGWFDWTLGRIHTKSPNRAILAKMLQLADRFGAVVQGDDGEIYRDASEMPGRPSASELSVYRWHRVIMTFGPIIMIAAVAWLVVKVILWLSG